MISLRRAGRGLGRPPGEHGAIPGDLEAAVRRLVQGQVAGERGQDDRRGPPEDEVGAGAGPRRV